MYPGLIVTLASLLLVSGPEQDGVPRLEAVSFARAEQSGAQLVRLHLTGRVTAFSDPERMPDGTLLVTLYNVGRSDNFAGHVPEGPVLSYRARPERGHMVIEFRLTDSVLSDVYRDRESDDLLVSLTPVAREADPTVRPVAQVEPMTLLPAETALPASPSDPGVSVEKAASRWRIDRIAIDAGHGGHDPGAIGSGRLREKDVVLPVALKLGGYLEEILGVEVIYTRTDDRFIGLRDRGRIANRAEADLFVSIHANSARNRTAHGTETYFLGMHKGGSAQAVIERENSVIQMEDDQTQYQELDQAAMIRFQLAQSAFLRQSEALASLVEDQFEERVQRRSRGVKEGNFQVLWAAAMPAVLIELGFVTNAEEAAFMRSTRGQDYLASAIFRAIRDYKNAVEQTLVTSSD